MVYLVGLVITPLGGIWISRVGSRAALIASVMAGIVGVLLTLVPNLLVILLGLVMCSSGVFVCQSAATTYIHRAVAVRWPRFRRRTLRDVLLHRRQRSRSPAGNVVALRPVEGLCCADRICATGNRSHCRRNLEGQGSLTGPMSATGGPCRPVPIAKRQARSRPGAYIGGFIIVKKLLLVAAFCCCAAFASAQEIVVAAAADLASVFPQVAARFREGNRQEGQVELWLLWPVPASD